MERREDNASRCSSSSTSSSRSDVGRAKLSKLEKAGYSVGHVLNDLCSSIWFSYFLIYTASVLNFGSKYAGIMLLIGQVADAVATPFVGLESDRNLNWAICNYGRKKVWHLLGTVCVLFSFPMIFARCIGCTPHTVNYAKAIYYSAFVVIFQFGWASVQISHLSLIPNLTPSSSERIGLNALRYAFTVASNITVYLIAWLVLHVDAGTDDDVQIGPNDAVHFRNIVLIVVAIGAVFSIIFHLVVREKHPSQITTIMRRDSLTDYSLPQNHLKWTHWFRVYQFYIVGIIYTATRLTVNLSQVYIPLYLQHTLFLSKESIATVPLVMYLSGFLFSFCTKLMNAKLGRKLSFFVGCIASLVAFCLLYQEKDPDYVYGVAALMGISGTTMLVTCLGITNDLIGHNLSSGAFVFGAMSFLDKFSNGLAVVLIQFAHPKDAGHHDPELARFYRLVLSVVCGGATCLGILGLTLLLPYKLEIMLSSLNGGASVNVNPDDVTEATDDSDDEPLLRP